MKKIKVMILFIVLGMLLIIPNSAHAGYQSKPGGVLIQKTPDVYFVGCRQMETSGGVLGLEEGLNDDYTGTTTGGNGIDAHLVLNTEWGIIALFTNSQYGVGASLESSSTGNSTGIYGLKAAPCEYTASTYKGTTDSKSKIIRSSNERYFNIYSDRVSKVGDALECESWLGATYSTWINTTIPVFVRGVSGLFGFTYYDGRITTRRSCCCCLWCRPLR